MPLSRLCRELPFVFADGDDAEDGVEARLLLPLLCRLCFFPGFIVVVSDFRNVSCRRLRREKSVAKGWRRRCCICCGVRGEAASCREPCVGYRLIAEATALTPAAPTAPMLESVHIFPCSVLLAVLAGVTVIFGGASSAVSLMFFPFLLPCPESTDSAGGTCTTKSLTTPSFELRLLPVSGLIASRTARSSSVSAAESTLTSLPDDERAS